MPRPMLIGAHVSPAGGPAQAVRRGEQRGAHAIQIFNQNPRAWRPRTYTEDEVAAYHAARRGSAVEALLVHAAYLLNCASTDREIRAKSLASLTSSLRAGAALGAHAVVVHPGSALRGDVGAALARSAAVVAEALAESDGCPLHLENTAGTGGTLGRTFAELATLVELAGGDGRVGVCLDSCHLLAAGYDVRTPQALGAVLEECAVHIGLDRLGSLHLNDSRAPLGSRRDRHANVGTGEIGREGCAAFLSEPRFDGLPCVLETPGLSHTGPSRAEIALARRLRARGIAARRG